ncbi:MAG TPA: alpha-L-arabinofuranosidase C-terminal domain-containing protein [Phototrophicaceae bacterium]|nr:alpha-L-arabinofuranosidase C-terminal domain-containing protein [Phototrophicaceae bacterium]
MMTAKIEILLHEPVATINPNIYGHFAEHLGGCIDGGFWVGEQSKIPNVGGLRSDVVEALKKLKPPVIRWPGGCFADDYHWQDGIGPRAERPKRVNIHWGNTIEPNEFGTHEFMAFCRAVGAEPYFCGNVGSGTPHELRDWVEYCNLPGGSTWSERRAQNGSPEPFRVKYWAVGNESWGCGGSFTPEEYATEYRRFSVFMRNYGDTPLALVACGPSGNDPDWTRRFFTQLQDHLQAPWYKLPIYGFAAHYYAGQAGTATEYTGAEWYRLLWQAQQMEKLVVEQRALMDEFDPQREIGLIVDEWGSWHPPTPGYENRALWQQNTLRDGLLAALTLDIFNRHADKVIMGNIAQTVNVLQAMILTEGDQMLLTPTYHVFDLYQTHQGAQSLRTVIETPDVHFTYNGEAQQLPGLMGAASLKDDLLTLTVVNPQIGTPVETEICLPDDISIQSIRETVLTDADIHAHNTLENPNAITLSAARELPVFGATIRHTFAAQSVTRLDIRL